jgi:hypothetical protein
MEKCFNHIFFHDVEEDIDSLYFVTNDDKNERVNQGFNHIIVDEKFIIRVLISDFQVTSIQKIMLIILSIIFQKNIEQIINFKKLLDFYFEKVS